MSIEVLERGMQDMYKAERDLRMIVEGQNREFRDVLAQLAYRLAGGSLEEIRREDPTAPGSWDPGRWEGFFRDVLHGYTGWAQPEGLREQLFRLRKTLQVSERTKQDIEAELRRTHDELANLRSTVQHGSGTHSGVNGNVKVPQAVGVDRPEIPRKPPSRFAARLGAGNRWRREGLVLYLMATKGWSVRLEILDVVGRLEKVSPRSGSLKRIFEKGLVVNRFVESEVLTINLSRGQTRMAVVCLTDEGRGLCQALGWEPVESDWERLVRLHQGETQKSHTMAVLAFAYHSRLRGWRAEVIPPVEQGEARPDVRVERGEESIFVEVELGEDKPAKWRNLATLQDFVALCAPSPEKRARLVSECKLDGLGGRATDIETLIQASSEPGPLWVETWL